MYSIQSIQLYTIHLYTGYTSNLMYHRGEGGLPRGQGRLRQTQKDPPSSPVCLIVHDIAA